jgi:hypothetical protein
MRILDFRPNPYRNLTPHTIRFTRQPEVPMEEGCSIRFLVGKNGTGKTNILRFLTSIFIALQEGFANPRSDSPAYNIPFHLTYQLRQSTVTIESKGSGRFGIRVQVSEKDKDTLTYDGTLPSLDLFFPKNILVYTSGNQNEWHSIFHPAPPEVDENIGELDLSTRRPVDERPPAQKIYIPDESSDSDSPKPDSDQTEGSSALGYRRVNLATSDQLKPALLSALLDNQYRGSDTSALKDALQEVNVRLLGFSLQIHLTKETVTTPQQRSFLSDLYDLASFPNQRWDDQQWVYDINQLSHKTREPLLNRLANLRDPFQFFQTLVSLQDSNILTDVKLVLEYTPQQAEKPKRILLSDDLSDGEFAFLSRMALIYLLNEEECLFLLDEPEVHFNDDWKRNLVDSIERALRGTQSEVILTSHASIVLTDAYPDEVILMTHYGQDDNIPLTFAAEQGEVLRHLFDSERSVGRRAMRKVESMLETGTAQEIESLLEKVGPGYYRFKIVRELENRVPPTEQDNVSTPK